MLFITKELKYIEKEERKGKKRELFFTVKGERENLYAQQTNLFIPNRRNNNFHLIVGHTHFFPYKLIQV